MTAGTYAFQGRPTLEQLSLEREFRPTEGADLNHYGRVRSVFQVGSSPYGSATNGWVYQIGGRSQAELAHFRTANFALQVEYATGRTSIVHRGPAEAYYRNFSLLDPDLNRELSINPVTFRSGSIASDGSFVWDARFPPVRTDGLPEARRAAETALADLKAREASGRCRRDEEG